MPKLTLAVFFFFMYRGWLPSEPLAFPLSIAFQFLDALGPLPNGFNTFNTETHIFELRNEEISVKKILAVINCFYLICFNEFHNFIFIFPGYITNQFNDQLSVGLLAQLVRALHRYRRGQGSNPGKPDFFRLSFRNCISSLNNCEDLLYTYYIQHC